MIKRQTRPPRNYQAMRNMCLSRPPNFDDGLSDLEKLEQRINEGNEKRIF